MIKLMLICCYFMSAWLMAAPTYSLSDENGKVYVEEYLYLSAQQLQGNGNVMQLPDSFWQLHTPIQTSPVLYSGENWLRFNLKNDSDESRIYYLSLENSPYIENVSLFKAEQQQPIERLNILVTHSNAYEVQVRVPAKNQQALFLNVVSDHELPLTLKILSPQAQLNTVRVVEYFKGVAIGGNAFLVLAMLFFFAVTKSKNALLLGGYFTCRTFILFTLFGSNLLSFYPDLSSIRGSEIPILTALSAIFLLGFSSALFSLKDLSTRYHKYLQWNQISLVAFMVLSWWLSVHSKFVLSMLIYIFIIIQLIYIGRQLAKRAIPLARLYTVIMSIQLLTTIIYYVGVMWPTMPLFSNNGLFLGVAFWLNGLLLILLVSNLFYLHIKEKQTAQRDALNNAMQKEKAQQALLALQEENQELLESRVQERTLELNIAFQELENVNKELAEKTTLDELTNLYNRRYYEQKIQAEFRRSRRNLTPLSLIVVDVDFFKKVNDTLGHLAGDECLVFLGKQIKKLLGRSSDVACRYGGEEFCLILPETGQSGAKALAEDLREMIAKTPVTFQNETIALTISCGCATYQQQENIQAEHLFLAADKALYVAKDNGRDQVQAYQLENLSF